MAFDPTTGQFIDDTSFAGQTGGGATTQEDTNAATSPLVTAPNVSPPAPTGPTFQFGSGDYQAPPSIDLGDPNQLALTGLTAAQRTTPQYQPLVTGSNDPNNNPALEQYQVDYTRDQAYNPYLKPQTSFTYNPIEDNANTYLTPGYYNPLDTNVGVGTAIGDAAAYGPANFNPGHTYDASQSGIAQASLDPNSLAQAAQGTVDPDSLVDEQYKRLTQGVPEGNVPDWARTAVTAARQQMNSLGLGASTMAGGATAGAILDAARPMAQQNAQTYANMNLANLSNRQQANLQNAQTAANLNLTNLQAKLTTLLSNTSMQNASKQFNAQSTQQAEQFFNQQYNQVMAQNADRMTAVSQFNATQKNTMAQFVENLRNNRLEFNAQQGLLIDQSNVQWRRAVNTANTAGQNSANQANVQNLFNLSQTAQNQLWQQARDEASWALTSGENSQNRLLSLVNSALNRQTSLQILASQLNANTFAQLGGLAGNLLSGGSLGSIASLFSGSGSGGLQGTDGGSIGGSAFDTGGGSDFVSSLGGGDFGGGGDFNFG